MAHNVSGLPPNLKDDVEVEHRRNLPRNPHFREGDFTATNCTPALHDFPVRNFRNRFSKRELGKKKCNLQELLSIRKSIKL